MLDKAISHKIGFGGVKLSTMPSLNSALNILEAAFDNGITYFDTAPLYGSGYSEKIIGKFAAGKRDKITIATKVGLSPAAEYTLNPSIALPLNYIKRLLKKKPVTNTPSQLSVLPYRLITKEYIKTSFEKSLQNLKTDYIDNYLLHEALPSFLDDEAHAYMLDIKAKKTVRNIGIATSWINFPFQKDEYFNWDILQYDYTKEAATSIRDTYPTKKHHLHSILSGSYKTNASENTPGYLIANCLKRTDADIILFSTADLDHLIENINAINTYYTTG
jgi:aryl-alcohol dehydrogenase-like predicted oxidoreductase